MADTQEQKTDNEESLVGQVFEGRFEVLSVLGRGGMGMVYKARHIHMDKIVAIKTLVQGAVSDENSFLRFEQEARTASSLEHPNIISVTDFGKSVQGFAYLVMEYINGQTLEDIIIDSESENISIARFLRVFSQACDGMQHAHKKGIIHRDLKPSNLMLFDGEDAKDKVKIVDFGLAKLSQNESQNLTQSGVVMGSPLYMSPEQGRGDELDPRSDIYSLGCVMYVALSGHVPLKGNNSMATIYKHISDVPPLISHVAPDVNVPRRLEQVVMRTLEKDPALRPQTMAELSYEIEDAIKSTDITKSFSAARPQVDRSMEQAGRDQQSADSPPRIAGGPPRSAGSAARSALDPAQNANQKSRFPMIVLVAVLGLGLLLAAGAWTMQSGIIHSADSTGSPGKNSTPAETPNQTETPTQDIATEAKIVTAMSSAKDDKTGEKGADSLKQSTVASKAAISSKTTSTTGTSKTETIGSGSGNSNASLVSPKVIRGEISTEKGIARKLSKQYLQKAYQSLKIGDISEAQAMFEKSLVQEKIAYGNEDPHLLPTLSQLLACVRKQGADQSKRADYLDAAIKSFSKDPKTAVDCVNEQEHADLIWVKLAMACFETAKSIPGPPQNVSAVKRSYFEWSTVFFEYARAQQKGPKDNEYYKTIRLESFAAKQCGKFELFRMLNQELLQSGHLLPRELDGGQPDSGQGLEPGRGPRGQLLDQGREMMRRRRRPMQSNFR